MKRPPLMFVLLTFAALACSLTGSPLPSSPGRGAGGEGTTQPILTEAATVEPVETQLTVSALPNAPVPPPQDGEVSSACCFS